MNIRWINWRSICQVITRVHVICQRIDYVLEKRISLYKVEYAVREYCTEVPEKDNVTIEMKDVSDMDNEATNEETTGSW